jgi:alkylation response protein AidB-like acyl-CoA dehydrogenase
MSDKESPESPTRYSRAGRDGQFCPVRGSSYVKGVAVDLDVVDGGFSEVLEGVAQVGSEAARRAEEIDRTGVIPNDLFDSLSATGCLRAMLPKEHGGLELPLAEINELIIAAAKANGSLGWTLMIGIPIPLIFGLLPAATGARLMSEYPFLRARGAIAPKGIAVRVDGGFVVSGRWPFASGGPQPDLVAGNCVVLADGAPEMGPDGVPQTVVAVLRAAQVEFLDTWHVLGLRGSDSRDFAVEEQFVPEDMTANIFTATNAFDLPVTRAPLRVFLATGHASVAVGIAQGALAEVTELAKTKRAAMNPTALLADDPLFRHHLGESTLRLAAAKAFLDHATATAWEAGVANRPLSSEEILTGRTMAGYVTSECVKVVDAAYTMAGSASLYDTSSLQRRLRDIHVATQHVAATSEAYRTLGAVLVGEQLTPLELF